MTPMNPRLRHPIDIRHEKFGDKSYLLLRCPLGITREPLGLVPEITPILASFNGTLSIQQIADKFKPQGATEEVVRQLADLLDQNFFLESPRFQERAQELKRKFAESPTRAAALSGACYSSEEQALKDELEKYLMHAESTDNIPDSGQLIGLVAPHIDYARGQVSYGKTYQQLRSQEHDLYILLGTAHQYSDHLFHLTSKHFESPLGTLTCDTDFMNELAKAYGGKRAFADEYLHKEEHSLELQVPFLKHLMPDAHIAPILVGSFHSFLSAEKSPAEFEVYEALAESLANLVNDRRARGQRVCFVAGVDMAHIGRAFGDSFSLTPDLLQKIRERDEQYLQAILTRSKEQLYAHIAEDGDARRICGYPTMYLTLDVLERCDVSYRTELFEYRQAVDFNKECAVTFAGMGFYL